MTIRIHRSRPIVFVEDQAICLTKDEHTLLTALGMMDNKTAPHSLLLEVMCEGRTQIQADATVLRTKIARLRKKVGRDHLQNNHGQGYLLIGEVQFIGDGVELPDNKIIRQSGEPLSLIRVERA